VDLLVSWSAERWVGTPKAFFAAAEALHAKGRRFSVSPCLDGHAQVRLEKTAARIVKLLGACTDLPAWPRMSGQWLVWTYNGGTLSPAQWRTVVGTVEKEESRPHLLILDLNAWLIMQDAVKAGKLSEETMVTIRD